MSGIFGAPFHSKRNELVDDSASFHSTWTAPDYNLPSLEAAIPENTLTATCDQANAKVPIPRTAQSTRWIARGRVSRACENCRDKKVKCSGNRPVCDRCRNTGAACFYGDRKKEKTVKELKELTSQISALQSLVRNFYPTLDASSSQLVDQTLREISSGLPLPQTDPVAPDLFSFPPGHIRQVNPPMSLTDVRPGFQSRLADYTEEDYDCDDRVRASGFVGEHSEVAWLYRLKCDLDQDLSTMKETPQHLAMSSMNFFRDDSQVLVLDPVDLACWPPQHVADKLVDAYFQFVHPAFPIFSKTTFLRQYRSFYSKPDSQPGKKWQTLLNLVFAIATRHLILAAPPWSNCDDHQRFFGRAWSVIVEQLALLDHPDLQQVQTEGLAAFYLLSVGQINRSWRIIGAAIRSAVTMGLNLRSESHSIPYFSKEIRYRLWWALFLLDTVLSEMTGRPLSTEGIFCTTPLPVPLREEDLFDERVVQLVTSKKTGAGLFTSLVPNSILAPPEESASRNNPAQLGPGQLNGKKRTPQDIAETHTTSTSLAPNTSLCFLYAVDLAHLLREAINNLYAPRETRRSCHDIETVISKLNSHADDWLSHLPTEFQFTSTNTNATRIFAQQRAILAFRFYATKLIITQPSLRLSGPTMEARSPGTLSNNLATICLQTACQMLDLLPDEPNCSWLYDLAPWLSILHNIMQSITVLLIELFTFTHIGTSKATGIIQRVKKAIQWLNQMSARDPSSQRAWFICMEILSCHGSKFGFDSENHWLSL
ncbi:hypothetical protein N7541_000623 [Penicillium brevicompactum]|uniref:Zn(2)-C6 fungal-type domain-containing protein n=1 Tax=Penicillium brevicompactum TaxID=5074 RepID=A0A9W9RUG9_PENBR|nr:hypothetical protein N7541_000623 [Penicillium brevicompactum]